MTFMGYRRPDGRVGIRNHVVVLPGVLCAAATAAKIAERTGAAYIYNPNGCGQCRGDTAVTLDVLAGLVANGNVYGTLIVGLGCESLGEKEYLAAIRARTDQPLHYIGIQKEGGIGKTVEAGIKIVEELKREADACAREEIDLSSLILGLECGGSDPTSGISANTVLGRVCDRLIDLGGTALLSETPEAIGAEHLLEKRGRTPEIGRQLREAVVSWEKAFTDATGEDIRRSNPSPGNKAAGITTLSEKSLGCIEKSGTRPFDGLIRYGGIADQKGLYFLDATAYDVANVTALAAAGAQLVAFTTGLGNPVGNPIVPVVKITGNRDTAARLADIIDFDTSACLTGEKTADALAEALLDYFLRVCGGETVRAEDNGACEVAINQNHTYA